MFVESNTGHTYISENKITCIKITLMADLAPMPMSTLVDCPIVPLELKLYSETHSCELTLKNVS